MAKDPAIVLNNGSINSAVATALAAQRYRPVMLHAIKGSVEDSDEPASRARVAFDQQVSHFKPYREHVLTLPMLQPLNPAMASKASPGASDRPIGPLAGQLLDLLPLLAIGARLACQYQASAIYLGLRVGGGVDELAQATEYLQIWSEMLNLPCGLAELEFTAPLLELDPWQVVDLGFQVSAPLERTWSCAGDGGEPCWACRGCRAREAAFQQAGKPDPIRSARRS